MSSTGMMRRKIVFAFHEESASMNFGNIGSLEFSVHMRGLEFLEHLDLGDIYAQI